MEGPDGVVIRDSSRYNRTGYPVPLCPGLVGGKRIGIGKLNDRLVCRLVYVQRVGNGNYRGISRPVPQHSRYREIRGNKYGRCIHADRPVVDRCGNRGFRLCHYGSNIICQRHKLVIVRHGQGYINSAVYRIHALTGIVPVVRSNFRYRCLWRLMIYVQPERLLRDGVLQIGRFERNRGHAETVFRFDIIV